MALLKLHRSMMAHGRTILAGVSLAEVRDAHFIHLISTAILDSPNLWLSPIEVAFVVKGTVFALVALSYYSFA